MPKKRITYMRYVDQIRISTVRIPGTWQYETMAFVVGEFREIYLERGRVPFALHAAATRHFKAKGYIPTNSIAN